MADITKQHYPELMKVSEVAHLLRVDDTTVRRYVKQGALEAVILPHKGNKSHSRIRRSTIEEMLGKSLA